MSLQGTHVNASLLIIPLKNSRYQANTQPLLYKLPPFFPPFSATLEAVQAANCPTQYAFFTRSPVTSTPALICSYMDMLCIARAPKCIIYAQSASPRLLLFFNFFFNCKQKSTPAVNLQLDSSAGRAGQVGRNIKAWEMSGLK